MEDSTIQLYLSRILSGYYIFKYKNKKLKLQYPDYDTKYAAELIALEEKTKNRFESWLTLNNILNVLTNQGLWTKESQDFLDRADKVEENYKIDIFKNFRNPSTLKNFRKKLASHRKIFHKLNSQKHFFDHITLEGYCEIVKHNYLLSMSVIDENNKLFLEENPNEIDAVSAIVSKNSIPLPYFRILARSNQWASFWYAQKTGNLFNRPIIEWTDEQRFLVSMSRMYDNAREHPECPDEDVFKDDDAFDGWAALEKHKQEKEKSKNRAEKMLPGKLKNASEVYVMANNQHEAKDIMNLNDSHSAMIIQERKAFLNKYGTVKESNLPDVQRDIIINNNNATKKRK